MNFFALWCWKHKITSFFLGGGGGGICVCVLSYTRTMALNASKRGFIAKECYMGIGMVTDPCPSSFSRRILILTKMEKKFLLTVAHGLACHNQQQCHGNDYDHTRSHSAVAPSSSFKVDVEYWIDHKATCSRRAGLSIFCELHMNI